MDKPAPFDHSTDTDSHNIKAALPPNPSQSSPETKVVSEKRFDPWLKFVPAVAILISLLSFIVSFTSLLFAMGYTRPHQDHDVVAKVLGVNVVMKGYSTTSTNGELSVDVALINRGNQTEIIREAFLCYSDTNDFSTRGHSWQRDEKQLNLQLNKGDRRVLPLHTPFTDMNTGKRLWLGITVRCVAPNGDDTEVTWPVCQIDLAPDGNGGSFSYNKDKTPLMEIISNDRKAHQKLAQDGF